MLEKIKELLGEELTTQVEAALKGKGKDGFAFHVSSAPYTDFQCFLTFFVG